MTEEKREDPLTLDFHEADAQDLIRKMLHAVVDVSDVHINRFTVFRRGNDWEYFVGQRTADTPTPFPQYTVLKRNIIPQLQYYGFAEVEIARDAPSGWYRFTDQALTWYRTHRDARSQPTKEMKVTDSSALDTRTVFVVHGRNDAARIALFDFLRAIGLKPLEWSQAVHLTGEGAPYIGQVLDHAFEVAQAVVVLLTPDEIAYLRKEFASEDDPEYEPAAQARPNVLFEAGMAFGRNPKRTILVELGTVRPFSDIAGRHTVRLNGSSDKRLELAQRLKTAGCEVDLSGTDWIKAGALEPPPPPGGGLPLGRRLVEDKSRGVRLNATYRNRGKDGVLQITNHGTQDIYDLGFDLPEEAGHSLVVASDLPVKKLPSGKSVSFPAMRAIGGGADHFEITITGKTADGDPISVPSFIDLMG